MSSSPHLHSGDTVRQAMLLVLLALAPAALFAVYHFGWYVLAILLTGTISAVLAETALLRFMKKPLTIVLDGSAALTGLLLALNVPAGAPLWMVAIGAFMAIIIGKHVFGGLGYNPFNPALVGRAILVSSWPAHMMAWVGPGLISSATPLAMQRAGEAVPPYLDLFFGLKAGSLGEVSVFLLLLGGIFLICKRVIDWKIPAAYLATVALMTWVLPARGQIGFFAGDPLMHVLSGGLVLGAFFMATDWVTSPVTKLGRVVMGLGAGIITAVIRLYGGLPEGVTFAILIMNGLTPLIDRYTMGRRFGVR
ncbi:MAG: RnfABCDGE type electron transport complex subunit D [Peptococcaceae bacterium]|nr:RnfABCDGE type electron transport complex subunit D [Peptococcaceae bacterium]